MRKVLCKNESNIKNIIPQNSLKIKFTKYKKLNHLIELFIFESYFFRTTTAVIVPKIENSPRIIIPITLLF